MMIKNILNSFKESIISLLPVYFIVILISIFLKFDNQSIVSFSISTIFLIFGISLFTFGTDTAMVSIGNKIGNGLIKSKKIYFILLSSLIIGTFITISEPDLMVLADQFTTIPNIILILTVSLGVGISLLLATIRTIFNIDFKTLLIISYTITFLLMFLVPNDYIPIAFDSGGVTTGPMSSAFILTLGLGFTAFRNDLNAQEEGFGFISLCSVGPIIAVLLLGLIFDTNSTYTVTKSTLPLLQNITYQFTKCLKEVSISLIPVLLIYFIYKKIFKNINKYENRKILLGLLSTLIGLTLFLTGANVGYINIGYLIGETLSNTNFKFELIPLGLLLGFFIEMAEPTVKIITKKIEDITEGSISKTIMQIGISIGVSIAVAISLYRALTGLNIFYILLVGYIIAILLSFFVPKIFTSIAFDCGGIVAGPLSACFLLPICIGSCLTVNGNIMTDAFGLIALLALTPPIVIQIIGLVYSIKLNKQTINILDDTIVEYGVNV